MARVSREFSAFGVEYRTKQFSAFHGLEIMEVLREIRPEELLSLTDVKVEGEWIPLSNSDNINKFVKDELSILPPVMALKALTGLVSEFSFGFLSGWTGAKVPTRFIANYRAINTNNSQPLIAQLVQDGTANLRDLQEFYSLEDGFKMFDIMMVKGINMALANEEASKPK